MCCRQSGIRFRRHSIIVVCQEVILFFIRMRDRIKLCVYEKFHFLLLKNKLNKGDFCSIDDGERLMIGSNNSVSVWNWRKASCVFAVQLNVDSLSLFHSVKWLNGRVVAALTSNGIYLWQLPIVDTTTLVDIFELNNNSSSKNNNVKSSSSSSTSTSSSLPNKQLSLSKDDSDSNSTTTMKSTIIAEWPEPIIPAGLIYI